MSQKRAVIMEINNACQLMEEHDSWIVKRVTEVKQYWSEQTMGIGEIVAPSNMEAKPPA